MMDKAKTLKTLADLRALVGSLNGDGDTMLAVGSTLTQLETAISGA